MLILYFRLLYYISNYMILGPDHIYYVTPGHYKQAGALTILSEANMYIKILKAICITDCLTGTRVTSPKLLQDL